MPGLIQRYSAVAEYSALISTNPSSPKRRNRNRDTKYSLSPSSPPPRTTRTTLREEVSEWYAAFAPPLEDLQAVIRRVQADPDLTQDRVFTHLCPAVVLCALFAVVLVAVREDSFVHRVLDGPSPDGCSSCTGAAVTRLAALAICSVALSVVALKCVIYGVAEACALVVAMETRAEMRSREERGVPTSGLVLGGMML